MAKKKRQPRVIARGKVLRINAGVQSSYVAEIMKHVDAMIKQTRKELEQHFEQDFVQEHVAMDASAASQTRILVNALKKRYDQLFSSIASPVSVKMADAVNRNSFQQTDASLKAMLNLRDRSKQLTLELKHLDTFSKTVLNATAARSADFIKTIPERYLNTVAEKVYSSIVAGNGMQDLIPFFQKHDTGTRNWVHNTAMDQTRKAFNGLNVGRMQKVGITKGEWIHSGGSQHPRELHEDYDGKTFDLNVGAPVGDDGGNNVMPGEEPNCRCTFGPVLTDDGPENATETNNEEEE